MSPAQHEAAAAQERIARAFPTMRLLRELLAYHSQQLAARDIELAAQEVISEAWHMFNDYLGGK